MKSDIDAVSARIRILQSRGFCVTDLRDVHDGIAATIDAYLSAGGSPREGWDSALHTRIADLEALVAKSEYLADRVDQVADSLPKMQEAIRRVESLKGKHATSGLLRSVTAGVTSAMASRDVTPVDAVYRAVQAQADTVVAFTSPVRR